MQETRNREHFVVEECLQTLPQFYQVVYVEDNNRWVIFRVDSINGVDWLSRLHIE